MPFSFLYRRQRPGSAATDHPTRETQDRSTPLCPAVPPAPSLFPSWGSKARRGHLEGRDEDPQQRPRKSGIVSPSRHR